jgi:sucrose-6-phosphate hydrolase SacC (GH32 family)
MTHIEEVDESKEKNNPLSEDPLILSYHLMHPGGPSAPGDPNAAFYLDGTYHLHYILRHPWDKGRSFSFVHVTSPDMLHWTWHETKLQPSFTGHGMFSGTGFITKEGRPAIIYCGHGSGHNQIVIAKDNNLSEWENPHPIEPMTADGKAIELQPWDPDCFMIGDTYYAYFATWGGKIPPLMKSKDLRNWTHIGDFLRYDLPNVAIGEDISCGNFFPIGDRWMLLCISHTFGCRYYIGDWDVESEKFVPEIHGRMNWRREDQSVDEPGYRDLFAPESILTPDGRRVMWAWCVTLDPALRDKTLQSLPRELSLAADGTLRIEPLRELESLRYGKMCQTDVLVPSTGRGLVLERIAELPGEALEIHITVGRSEAEGKRFGFYLFSTKFGEGLPIMVRPETGTLRVGSMEAPFSVTDLPPDEDFEVRIFVDKYLVEVFASGRQAMIAAYMDYRGKTGLDAYSFTVPTTTKKFEIWKLKPTNQGYLEAWRNRIWEPKTK